MPKPVNPWQTSELSASPSALSASDQTEAGPSNNRPPTPIFGPPSEAGEVGTLGPYRIVKQLGEGGMGAVYAAIDTRLNRRLALKVMLPRFAADASAKERFLREARAAAQITHDNVVTVYEADERDGVPYIAMQFLEGYPLDQYLKKKGNPPLAQVLRIGREAAAGLAAAHKLGLVHRDIKPANLWLEAPEGRVKVLDFGLAKPMDGEVELTKSGAIVGTPAYMSPEQARSKKVDHRSDLFSLGAVLYRLCTGRLPFEGANTMAVLMALGTEEPPAVWLVNPDLPQALGELIHRLLAKDPGQRVQTADELVKRIRKIEDELAIPTAKAVGAPAPTVEPMVVTAPSGANPFADIDLTEHELKEANVPKRNPTPARKRSGDSAKWVLVGVAALVLVIGGVGAFWMTRENKPKNDPPDNTNTGGDGKTTTGGTGTRTANPFALEFSGEASVGMEPLPFEMDSSKPSTIEAYCMRAPSGHKDNGSWPIYVEFAGLSAQGNVWDFWVRSSQDGYQPSHEVIAPAVDNAETHVAGVFTGKELRLYINGKLAKSKDVTGITPRTVGKPVTLGQGYAGRLREVRISKVARYQNDFTPKPWFETDKDTVALYHCDEGQGTEVKDSSGNNHHGKIVGAKWVRTTDSPDRKAALYVLSVGGSVKVSGEDRNIIAAADLPKGRFTLTHVSLDARVITDAGLAIFKDCKGIIHLGLSNTAVTDAGLANFKDCKGITDLWLHFTSVTDAGMANFRDCKELAQLNVGTTKVTDVGLANFRDCKRLTILYLNTLVTDEGLANFEDCKELATLYLNGCTAVTDAGLAHLKNSKALTHLDLGGTKVTDIGLGHFRDCPGLTQIHLNRTKITGSGLVNFKDCKNLTNLYLTDTAVTDAGLTHVKDCTGLSHLHLTNTSVGNAGLANLKACQGLAHLYLGGTAVTDDGLAVFKNRKGLAILILVDTRTTDAGLDHLRDCTGLQHLDVRNTKVTPQAAAKLHASVPGCKIEHDGGTIEAEDPDRKGAEYVISVGGIVQVNGAGPDIRAATDLPKSHFSLTYVNLNGQAVTDAGLANFLGCKAITSLALTGTNATDAGLASFKDCKGLTYLELTGTKVTAVGLAHFKGCKNLATLILTDVGVTDSGMANFKDCVGMIKLGLAGAKLTDAGLVHVKGFTALKHLNLSSSSITDAGLAHLKDCTELTELALNSTKVSGASLSAFKNCKNLVFLNLNATAVSETGLESFKGCKNLATVDLAGTGLTDAGLANFKDCKSLARADLAATKITDAGLVHLKDWKALQHVSVWANDVTDAGLVHLAECTALLHLDVGKTKVTAKGLAAFHATVPGCKIVHDGGTIEAGK